MENEKKIYVDIPKFSGENVPISVVSKIMKKDAQFIRLGLQNGSLPIGTAYKKDADNVQFDYYISPFLLWKYTGYIYDDKKGIE